MGSRTYIQLLPRATKQDIFVNEVTGSSFLCLSLSFHTVLAWSMRGQTKRFGFRSSFSFLMRFLIFVFRERKRKKGERVVFSVKDKERKAGREREN